MDYQAISTNSLYFEISNKEQVIGQLIYKNWFKFNAEINILNSKYQIEPKGFWGTTVEVKDGENVILKFTMNWDGNILLQTYFNKIEKDYIFKHSGFFKESFILTDQKNNELLVMKPKFKWNSLKYEYEITTSVIFETFEEKDILLLNSLHCANYFMAMMMGM